MKATIAFAIVACSAPPNGGLLEKAEDRLEGELVVFTEDVDRFWEAYDAITATDDPALQLEHLNRLYIDRGSPGLHAMMRARRYTTSEFLDAINNYPAFWAAVRENTADADRFAAPISEALKDMKSIYTDGKDVPVYFVIGALRAAGTANDNKLLIGAELAMADAQTPSHEFEQRFSHLAPYFAGNPIDGLVDLNLHEYVHTQQRTISGYNLLSQSLFEGVAEYVSTDALGRASGVDAIRYGAENHDRVIAAFERDILKDSFADWIWNSPDNEFGVRDLGYYVGYIIAKRYVEQSPDPQQAIKTLIELDYLDGAAVNKIVDESGVFQKPIADY